MPAMGASTTAGSTTSGPSASGGSAVVGSRVVVTPSRVGAARGGAGMAITDTGSGAAVASPSLLQPQGSLIPAVRRIAVLRANSIGDFVLALPALAALRAAYPAARITYLGEPWHPQLLDGRPGQWDEAEVVPPYPGVSGGA